MAVQGKAPPAKFARPGANPTLETIEYILGALRGAGGPISRNRLLAALSKWGHSTTRQSLNAPPPSHRAVARRVRAYRSILLADCLHGEVVPRDRIPKVLREKYGLGNLYVEDLPSFWRLLYTIVRDRGQRYIVVIESVDHQTYSRWFSGRR